MKYLATRMLVQTDTGLAKCVCAWTLCVIASMAAAQVPALPAVPTADSCRAYMLDNHARRADIHRETSDCLRKSSWNFSDRYVHQVCRHPPPRLEQETSPYNCPQRAAELCALVEAERLIAECYRSAKRNETRQEELQQKLAAFNRLEKQLGALKNAKKDPRRLFWDVVEPRLPTDTRIQLGLAYQRTNDELAKGAIPLALTKSGDSLFTVNLFERNGEFSQRGSSLMQQTYDFVYARTIGDKRALLQKYNNPVINAIQGTAAEEIKRVHSSIVAKIDSEIAGGVDSILTAAGLQSSPTRPSSSGVATHNPIRQGGAAYGGDPACAVLDGPEGAELSINSPDAFEKLLAKCRR